MTPPVLNNDKRLFKLGGVIHFGGPEGDRTLDLTDANRTLSQSGKFSANGLRCMVCQKLIIQHLQKPKFAMAFSIDL